MRQVLVLCAVVLCAAVLCAAAAASAQVPRYSAGIGPAGNQAQSPATYPAPAAQGQFTVQASAPPAALQSQPQASPQASLQAPLPAPVTPVNAGPLAQPELRMGPVIASHPVYSAGDPPPPAPAIRAPVLRADVQPDVPPEVETVVVKGYRGYVLGPGDKVHVTVYGEPDLTGDFEVSIAGRIAFPLIGEVPAAGATAPQLADRLAGRLAGNYLLNPKVSVEVATYRPFFVTGQVTKPGSYPYASGMTLSRAIATAGGFTPQAIASEVYVRHENDPEEYEVPVDTSTQIAPGDVVRVEQSTFWSVVSALVPLATIVGVIRSGIP